MNASIERPSHLALKLLLLALMGLIVAYPLFQADMVCGADFPSNLAHAVELDRLIRQGVWYPRWSPDFVFGYGYSTFNFYPPLPRYLAVALHGLGLPLRDAVEATIALSLLLAGPAMYLFARSILGERAALVAGLSYTFSPYLVNSAMQRFAVGEALAMAFAPLTFLAFSRLQADGRGWGRRVVLAALAYAVLIVTHTLMTLLFTPILAAYLVLLWWFNGRSFAFIGRTALAGILALGLAAFFWIPFVAEVGWVQMWRASILDLTGELLYPLNFISLRNLIWPPMLWPDYARGEPLSQRYLALPQLILAVLALVLRPPSKIARPVSVLWAVVLIVATFLVTPAARPMWDNIRPFRIIQFPWRLLAPASFCLAVLAGFGFATLRVESRISNLKTTTTVYALLMAVFVVWTLPWVRPVTCAIDPNPSSEYLLWVDLNHIGGGSGGEFLPKWVEMEPTDSPLIPDLLAGKSLDRLDRASLPESAQAILATSGPLESRWEIASPRAFTALFNNFYFPGWSVRADGVPVSIRPAPSTSLILADLPVGKHRVTLRLDLTRAQVSGNIISLLSIVGATLAVVLHVKSPLQFADSETQEPVPAWEWKVLAIIGLLALAVRWALAGLAPAGPALPPGMTHFSTDLAQVQLLGYEFSSPQVRAGETLTVTLYWQASHLLVDSYKSFIHLTDASGQIVAQSDAVPGNWARPTYGWLPGQWVADPHVIRIPASAPLDVWIGMYDPATGQSLHSAGDESGRVRLGRLTP